VYSGVWFFGIGIVVVSLVAGHRRLGRDLVLAIALVVLGSGLLGVAVTGSWPALAPPFVAGGSAGYPAVHLAFVVAVVVVARPDLIRPMRRLATWLVLLAAVAVVVVEDTAASAALGGVALGLAAGALVRLAFGSSAGFPDRERVLTGLDDLDLSLVDLEMAPHQPPGAATYLGRTVDGRSVEVKVYGSDARDAQFLAKVWRAMSYRDAGPEVAYSRLQQVEHESLMTLLAARAGVAVPDIVAVGAAGSGDALLVTTRTDGPRLDAMADGPELDDVLDALWRSVGLLRTDGIAHGRLNTRAVAVGGGQPILLGFGAGRMAAPAGALSTDVAELLVATALTVGADRALEAALDNLGPDAITDAIPYLQRAALTPSLRDEVRHRGFDLVQLRKLAADRTGAELPDVVQLHRVSLRDVVFMGLLAVAAYLIISQFADIGFETIWEELSSAQWEWLVVTLVVAQLIYLSQAVAVQGAIPAPLPYGPTVLLQSALRFIGLTVPTTAGRIALTLRYFQRLGVEPATALASSALDGIAGSCIQIILFIIVWPSVDFDLDLSASEVSYSGLFWLGVAILAGGVLATIAAILMPKVRARIVPHVKAGRHSLAMVFRSPRQLGLLVSGNLGNEAINALALAAASHAYGPGVAIGEALIIAMGVTLFTSIVPVPGGIGVAEAALTTGLVAVGVPESQAFAAALTYRLATFYLPPIWGYVSLRWLSDKGYV
jgi:uncharacterized membrane protein YbhN (UPF0104 family)/tRNA A-37 threonylcarbamoyl transferase component Bud32